MNKLTERTKSYQQKQREKGLCHSCPNPSRRTACSTARSTSPIRTFPRSSLQLLLRRKDCSASFVDRALALKSHVCPIFKNPCFRHRCKLLILRGGICRFEGSEYICLLNSNANPHYRGTSTLGQIDEPKALRQKCVTVLKVSHDI